LLIASERSTLIAIVADPPAASITLQSSDVELRPSVRDLERRRRAAF